MKIEINDVSYEVIDLPAEVGEKLARMPYIHRILLENVIRTAGDEAAGARKAILDWVDTGESDVEIPFLPNRVLMHDTTCGPALVDIAACVRPWPRRGAILRCSTPSFPWMSRPTTLSPSMRSERLPRWTVTWRVSTSAIQSVTAS